MNCRVYLTELLPTSNKQNPLSSFLAIIKKKYLPTLKLSIKKIINKNYETKDLK